MCTFLNIRSASAKSLAAAFLNICLATVSFAKGPDLVVADIWEQNHQIYFSISNIGQDLCPGGHTAWLFVDAQQVDAAYISAEIAPGKSHDGVFPKYYWNCQQGQYSVLVRADSKYVIQEENDQNNDHQETWQCDTTPPTIISGPDVSDVRQDSATIRWVTNEASDTRVEYGDSMGVYHNFSYSDTMVTQHEATLSGLSSDTTYYFFVKSADAGGNSVESKSSSFETLKPESKPDLIIMDFWAIGRTIHYEVHNTGGADAPAQHMTSLSVGASQVDADLVPSILSPGLSYVGTFENFQWECETGEYVLVVSADMQNSVDEEDEKNNDREELWECDYEPPQIIDGPRVWPITRTSATISWTTNEDCNSVVKYDECAGVYGLSASDENMTVDHKISLEKLKPGTMYHFIAQSTDRGGNTVSSKEGYFRTLVDDDGNDPVINSLAATGRRLPMEFSVDAFDDVGVDRVEFYVDDVHAATDFTAPYQFYLDPVRMGMERHEYYSDHTIAARAYDLSGGTSETTRSFAPEPPCIVAELDFLFPYDGYTIDVAETHVPAGTPPLSVHIQASETPWREWTNRYGITVQQGEPVEKIEFYVNDVCECSVYETTELSCDWEVAGLPIGEYELAAKVYSHDRCLDSVNIHNIFISPYRADVQIESRSVVRVGNYFRVDVTLRNRGHLAATLHTMTDNVYGFQPVPEMYGDYEVEASDYSPGSRQSEVNVTCYSGAEVPAIGTYTVSYKVVPILYPGFDGYWIGVEPVTVTYSDSGGTEGRAEATIPREGRSFREQVSDAITEADYLLVTSPRNLAVYRGAETPMILGTMADLAMARNGVLGYFQSAASMYTGFREGWRLVVGDAADWSGSDDEIVYLDCSYDRMRVSDPGERSASIHFYPRDIRSSDNVAVVRRSPLVVYFVRGYGEYEGWCRSCWYDGHDRRWRTGDPFDTSYNNGDGFVVGVMTDYGRNVVIGNHEDGTIDIYSLELEPGAGFTWQRVAQLVSAYEEGDFFLAGDVTGDSKDEMIVGDIDGDMLYIYDGTGTLLLSDPLPMHGDDGLAVGDVRGDDKEEIIFADASEDIVHQYNCAGVGGSPVLNHLDSFGFDYSGSDVLAAGNMDDLDKEEIIVVRGRSEHDHLEGEVEIISVTGAGGSRDRNALDDLINEGGEWAEKMDPNWTTDGYLLLVGDTKIIPAFSHGTDLHGIGYRRIPASDNDYASTDGEVYYPNLSVGRSIGDLTSALNNSLGILRGDYTFDNSFALAASGASALRYTGTVDFRPERDSVADKLALKGFTVTVLHDPPWLWEWDLIGREFPTVFHLAGHGTRETWNGLFHGAGFRPGDSRPLIYANASRTGDYHAHDDHPCLAEDYLEHGACAYIGATERCYYPWAKWLATRFYDQLGPGETVGRALKQAKRNLIGAGRYSWDRRANGYTSEMFHLFGDPKLELTWSSPPASAMRMSSKSAAAPSTLQRDLPSSIQINVPDYTVRSVDGNDYVEIPQGAALLVPCKPEVPVYTVSIDWPSGSRVQDVVMTDMGSAATDTGLNIPTIVPDEAHSCDEYVPESTGPEGPGWWPDRRFDWRIVEEPGDATTLLITVYPFYYNSDSTDIRFYNTYSFNIESKTTTVQILRFETDSLTYASDQTVRADIELLNSSSQPMELIVESVIKSHDSEVVAGMPLRMLSPVAGLASCSYHWDSNGYDADDYTWEIVVKDTVGDVLNKATCPFSLGIALAEIIKLGVAPECFTAGESVNIAASLSNNGETTISGTIVLDVQDMSGTQITRFQEDFNDLAPQNSTDFSTTWDSASISRGNCRILAYALHDGRATPARCFPETHPYANGDFDDSGTVNLTDLAMLTSHWHTNELSVDIAPPGGDCTVNFLDLALLAEHWLED